ncbi:YqgE/AlgH family protein [Aliamphritea hakodatensis]|uniref:YqgE/AlgH family protein n=1 Tax=Aliamphritea hakodatensis TaxID=2895352 RepID=UPI0022FDACFC|nr:YqgE/AlgH family protein [Aliamphritea hakodatensis]
MSLPPDSDTPGNHQESMCLRDHFLISMPHMHDGNFAQSLTYICDHNEHGAMGIIINRPLDLSFQALLSHLEIEADHEASAQPVYAGGPVQTDKGFVLHLTGDREWSSSYDVSDRVSITSSLDILEDLANSKQQIPSLVALGYAGWGAGQLEDEIRQNAWLSCPANLDILFHMPAEQRLHAAAASLGVNLDLMTAQSGHA